MKNQLFSLFCLLLSVGLMHAQSSEGTLSMELVDVSSDNPQVAQFAEMMKGTSMIVSFQGSKSLSEMNMMGGMVDMKILAKEDGTVDMLMNMMGQKMYIPTNKLEQEKAKAMSGQQMPELDITYDENDKKQIAGFNCYKMIVKAKDVQGFGMTAYVTEEIVVKANIIQNIDMSKFKGFPLEYTIDAGEMAMTFSAKKYESTVDAKKFELNTSGYTKMTLEEFSEMTGGMGGAFGF